MLTLFRRHIKSCPHAEKGRTWRKCHCPISVEGRLQNGRTVRRALSTTNWAFASELALQMEAGQDERPPITVEEAVKRFMANCEARSLSAASMKKYRVLLSETRPREGVECSPTLLEYAKEKGIQLLKDVTGDDVRAFRAQWHDAPLAASKKLERLRSFFRFGVDSEWIVKNPAKAVKPPVLKDGPTLPFTEDELKQLYGAIPAFRSGRMGKGKARGSDHLDRLEALLRVMEFSGLRIGDAVGLSTDDLDGDRLFLDTAKTGIKVYVPLPKHVLAALKALPFLNGKYFFWTGEGDIGTAGGNYRRTLKKLASYAELDNVHPHRMRDTMATMLLSEGVPVERVAAILGHKDIRITQRHYSAWIQARQDQTEADVRKVWEAWEGRA